MSCHIIVGRSTCHGVALWNPRCTAFTPFLHHESHDMMCLIRHAMQWQHKYWFVHGSTANWLGRELSATLRGKLGLPGTAPTQGREALGPRCSAEEAVASITQVHNRTHLDPGIVGGGCTTVV
eukprot:1656730-Amphidinium_carterae.2